MNNEKNIILVPGTGQRFQNYGYEGLDIWITDEIKIPSNTKCFIGHSLGASYILQSNINRKNKFILINPLIRRRFFIIHFLNWIKFMFFEGFPFKKAVPSIYWWHNFKQVLSLLQVDVLEELKKIPRENIIIIRGTKDNYFCDKRNAEILKRNNFNVIEVDSGHDWNENVAKMVADIL